MMPSDILKKKMVLPLKLYILMLQLIKHAKPRLVLIKLQDLKQFLELSALN